MRLAALLLVAGLAAPALAADERRSFAFEYGGDSPDVRARVEEQLPRWNEDVLRDLEPGAAWNERDCGPFDVVRNAAHVQYVVGGDPGLELRAHMVSVDVDVHDPGLPSVTAAADALALRVADWYREHIEAVAATTRSEVRKPLELAVADTNAARNDFAARLDDFDRRAGDPTLDREIAAERLRRAESEFAETTIDHAVAARKLDAARAAAKRAVDVRALEERLKDATADVELAKQKPETYGDALRVLKETRALLDEASSKSPTLESARERVASLEVELIAAESREMLLAKEIADLRTRLAPLRAKERERDALVRDADAARRRADAAQSKLAETSAKFVRPAWRLVWPVTQSRR